MPTISVTVRGFEEALRRTNRLLLWKVGLHRPLGDLLKAQHERRVEHTKTAPNGVPWSPLRPYTIAKKESRGHPSPDDILVDSRRMLGSFHVNVHGDVIRLTNPSRYTIFHQGGTRYMVARPFLGISHPGVNEIKRLVIRHISALLRRP